MREIVNPLFGGGGVGMGGGGYEKENRRDWMIFGKLLKEHDLFSLSLNRTYGAWGRG